MLLGKRMVQTLSVLLKAPIRGIFVNVRPAESIAAVRWIPGIIYLMPFSPEPFHDLGQKFARWEAMHRISLRCRRD